MTTKGKLLVAASGVLATALVCLYFALGGADYEPTQAQDPCTPREWREPSGLDPIAQQFALSALDGAACYLGISREELAIEIATRERDESDPELEAAVRAGVERAISDAEAAGAVSGPVAFVLTEIATRLPVDEAVEVIENSDEFIAEADAVIDDAGGVIDDAGDFIEGIPGVIEGLLP